MIKAEFTKDEYKKLDTHLLQCGYSRDKTRFYWEDIKAFGVFKPASNSVSIQGECMGMIKEITPCAVHELTHRKQYERSGSLLAYYFGLTLLRWAWEREAKAAEKEAEHILGINLGE